MSTASQPQRNSQAPTPGLEPYVRRFQRNWQLASADSNLTLYGFRRFKTTHLLNLRFLEDEIAELDHVIYQAGLTLGLDHAPANKLGLRYCKRDANVPNIGAAITEELVLKLRSLLRQYDEALTAFNNIMTMERCSLLDDEKAASARKDLTLPEMYETRLLRPDLPPRSRADPVSHWIHRLLRVAFQGEWRRGAVSSRQSRQFLVSELRDDYGGSPEKRCRFVLELMGELANTVGQDNLAIRLSPFGLFNQARGEQRLETWGHLSRELKKSLPTLSYVSFIEPRYEQIFCEEQKQAFLDSWGLPEVDLSQFRKIFGDTPFLSAGGWNDENAWGEVESGKYDALLFGRYFISNPDLVERLREGRPLTPYDRSRFYGPFPADPHVGYTDYPTWAQQQKKEDVLSQKQPQM